MSNLIGAHHASRISSGHAKDGTAQYDFTWAVNLGIRFNSFDLHRLSTGTPLLATMLRRMLDTAKTQGITEHVCCLDLGSIPDSKNSNWSQQLTAAIRRLPEVGYYMLTREPNAHGITVEDYVRFQQGTIPIIRAANPNAKIVSGCLGATHERAAWDWWFKVMSLDKSTDIVAVNFLGIEPKQIRDRLQSILSLGKPIWIGELGYPDLQQPHGWIAAAQYALDMGVQRVIYAPWPEDNALGGYEDYGILMQGGAPKEPQYSAMKRFIAQVQK